jgi:hypothetical protein
MILVTTLIIMLIVTIMGAGLLFTSQVELTTTSTYRQNLKAYNYADTLARLAIRAADVIVSGTADDVSDHLSFGNSDFVIEINESALNSLNSDVSLERLSVKQRYLRLGSIDSPPDLIVRNKSGKLVGTIMISHDLSRTSTGTGNSASSTVGGSVGISDTGSSGGTLRLQNYIITVSGRDPVYQAQSFFDDDEISISGPQTFITILYSVVSNH